MLSLALGSMAVSNLLGATSSLHGPSYPELPHYSTFLAQHGDNNSCKEGALNPEFIGLRDGAAQQLKRASKMTIWTSDGQKIDARVASERSSSLTVAILGVNCVSTNSGNTIRVPRGLLNSRLQTNQNTFLDMVSMSTSMDYYGYTLVEYKLKAPSPIVTGDPVATLVLGTERLRLILVQRDDRSTDSWGLSTSRAGYSYTGLIPRKLISGLAARNLEEGRCIVLTNDGESYRCAYGMNALLSNHLTIHFDAQRIYPVRPSSKNEGTPLLD